MRVPDPPSGSPPYVSSADMDRAVQKVYAGVGLEQNVTLTPWESWLLLRAMQRLEHNASSRRSRG